MADGVIGTATQLLALDWTQAGAIIGALFVGVGLLCYVQITSARKREAECAIRLDAMHKEVVLLLTDHVRIGQAALERSTTAVEHVSRNVAENTRATEATGRFIERLGDRLEARL